MVPGRAFVLSGMAVEPRDPEFARRTRENFSSQGFMRSLGTEMTGLGPGTCELTLDFRGELAQQHGYFHGGVVATLADVSGGYAAFSLLPADRSNVTVELKLSLVAPGVGPRLVARAEVLKAGRTLTFCRSDVWSVADDGAETLCATALATYMALA
jgi:uncharacterized protein (TIGR00369 family)